jgi:hypothetical protein
MAQEHRVAEDATVSVTTQPAIRRVRSGLEEVERLDERR